MSDNHDHRDTDTDEFSWIDPEDRKLIESDLDSLRRIQERVAPFGDDTIDYTIAYYRTIAKLYEREQQRRADERASERERERRRINFRAAVWELDDDELEWARRFINDLTA